MNFAILGNGKTGKEVQTLLTEDNYTVFNQSNHPTLSRLKGHDVIISFLPGTPFVNLIPLFIESKIPVVTGSTGFVWPDDINSRLISNNLCWIYANNFSLGMNIINLMISRMKQISLLTNNYSFSLHEIHHSKKLDTPSGTAKEWKKWLNEDITITSERVGDVIGIHELNLDLFDETITLKHNAKSRKVFATGALFAAEKILQKNFLSPGLHQFNEMILKLISCTTLSSGGI